MLNRRAFVLTTTIGLFAGIEQRTATATPAATDDPVAIASAIYTRIARGKGDSGGDFVTDKASRAKYLSKALVELWAKADAHTPKDDVGPVDFDPVTNSQDPDVKSFKLVAEQLGADRAAIAVTIIGHGAPPKVAADQVIRYDFVREAAGWRIDDIKGSSDGEPWSVRKLCEDSLKIK